MSRLIEANWKALLSKPKNLGLMAQGTGISKKLRTVEEAEKLLKAKFSEEGAGKVVNALKDLGKLALSESGKHKMFTEATKYMADMAGDAKKRIEQVEKAVKEANSKAALDKKAYLMEHLNKAVQALKSMTKVEDFHKGGELDKAARALMKIDPYQDLFKGDAYTLVNSLIMVESNRKKVKSTDWNTHKLELAKVLGAYKKCVDKLK